MSTHRIEGVVLGAPRSRLWRAISDAQEFGTWFQVNLEVDFAPGARVRGKITGPGYEHVTIDVLVERVEPGRLFSYRWHSYAVAPGVDYSDEPTTLVEFLVEEGPGGTRLTVVESGFDQLSVARRAEALRMNEGGWAEQIRNVERYVAA